MDYVIAVFFLILSYLIGAIPFGLLLGKSKGQDIRSSGSGNIGTTNALRVLGKKAGIIVGLLDILKATVVVTIIRILEHFGVWYNPFVINGDSLYVLYAFMAVIGHCFPVFLKFHGGKAVATSCGLLLCCAPWLFLIAITTFALMVIITGYVSVASISAALSAVIFTFIIYNNYIYTGIVICLSALLLIIRHHANIKRLINGTESNFKKKIKEQKKANPNE